MAKFNFLKNVLQYLKKYYCNVIQQCSQNVDAMFWPCLAASFQQNSQQFFKYSCNIAIFQRNFSKIFSQYFSAMWEAGL